MAIEGPQILTSSDGVEWQATPLPDGSTPSELWFVDGYFLSAGPGGWIRSTDGVSWEALPAPLTTTGDVVALVANTTSIFGVRHTPCCFGEVPPGNQAVFSAPRGTLPEAQSWLPANLENLWLRGAAASDDALVVTTSAGMRWASLPLDPDAFQTADQHFETSSGVVHADGRFVAVGDDHVYTSLDGKSWTAHSVPPLSLD